MLGNRKKLPLAAALAAVVVSGACASSDRATAPQTPTGTQAASCGGASGTVQLAELQSARFDCSAGTAVTLPGKGASYLVVPNLAVGGVPNAPTSYVIGATGVSATASVSPLPGADVLASVSPAVLSGWAAMARSRPGPLQRWFDARMRRLDTRRLTAVGGARSLRVSSARASVSAAPPVVGSLRVFHVISTLDTIQVRFAPVAARLEYAGSNILLYVDTLAPANGFTSTDIANFGATFDQVLYPIDVNAFGPPSDIDQNGHLVMLLSPVVNSLTTRAECAANGYVGGFFSGGDLVDTDTTSNQGEVFYALAPDPAGTFSCAHPAQSLEDELGATFLHELQHLINFSQHVLVHRSDQEQGWLDEGLSIVAEELGAKYYEDKYPAPSGRTNPLQIFPDSAEGYAFGFLFDSYSYLLRPDTSTVTLHSDDEGGLNWRGGDWALVHWLGDQKGGNAFYRSLVESSLTGIPNIEAAASEPFPTLFGDFSLALYTDSLPGIARAQIPARDRFTTRNLRRMYAALYRVNGPSADVPFPFPIQPQPLPATGTVSASLVPGTMAFYRATASSTANTVTITFSAPSGGSLPASLHPQLSIFRLPPGQ